MALLCIDELENLEFQFEENDIKNKSRMERWLDVGDFKRFENLWSIHILDEVKLIKTISDIENKCIKLGIPVKPCQKITERKDSAFGKVSYKEAKERGQKIKDFCSACEKLFSSHTAEQLSFCQKEFKPNVGSIFKRELNSEQKNPVHHALEVGHVANFSVPGSGKTTITYAALSRWLEDGIINKILVIGPTASFFPWEDEYRKCFEKDPYSLRPTGNQMDTLADLKHDMLLVHFATVWKKTEKIIEFLKKPENKVAVIIDESHNIKNIDLENAKWSNAVKQIAPFAERRIILSGTPMPNSASDLWVQFNFLWPHDNLLGKPKRFERYTKRHGIGIYKSTIDPLFTRVRKKDLKLDQHKPKFVPYEVALSPIQKKIYHALAERTLNEIYDFESGRGNLQKFRKARLIRMMQASSNPALLHDKNVKFTIDDEYGVKNPEPPTSIQKLDKDIYKKIEKYTEQNEIPSKMVLTEKIVRKLIENGEKVIVWTNFIKNIKVLQEQVLKEFDPIVIYGEVSKDSKDLENRDNSIKKFKDDANPRVLIATPPALSESVSLHINEKNERVCNHAIYLDRNYNCAQYVQSLDRIHRVGMDVSDNSSFSIEIDNDGEKKQMTFRRNQVYYHVMIGKDTIDTSIDERLNDKFERMNAALNDDWPQCLDYDGRPVKINDDSLSNDMNSLVSNLKNSVDEMDHDNN